VKNSPLAWILASRIKGLVAEAEAMKVVPHKGLRGRFRELTLTRLMQPLMPPSCVALHGTAVDTEGKRFEPDAYITKTEDDILIVDRDRVPAILFSEGEGIVPIDAVLARIEVKSVVTRDELRDALHGAISFNKIPLVIPDEDLVEGAALQCLFAFGSDVDSKNEHVRLMETLREEEFATRIESAAVPPINALCIVGKGAWVFGKRKGDSVARWRHCPADAEHSEVITFVGLLLNTLPSLREKRHGARLGSHIINVEEQFKDV